MNDEVCCTSCWPGDSSCPGGSGGGCGSVSAGARRGDALFSTGNCTAACCGGGGCCCCCCCCCCARCIRGWRSASSWLRTASTTCAAVGLQWQGGHQGIRWVPHSILQPASTQEQCMHDSHGRQGGSAAQRSMAQHIMRRLTVAWGLCASSAASAPPAQASSPPAPWAAGRAGRLAG